MSDEKKGPRQDELDSIKSSAFGRGLSMLNMSLNTGSRLAAMTARNLFRSENEKQEGWQEFLKSSAEHLAKELGRLKGTLMKTGQLLSVYGEHFLPKEVNAILKTLQADSQPVSWKEMERILNRELGAENLALLDIDPVPIKAASLGQVHRAIRKQDGLAIALKIQYPGVEKAIESDLKTLRTILSMSRLVPKGYSFDELFKEVRMMLNYEVDYVREAKITEEFRALLADDPRYVVPQVIPELSTKRVIATTFQEGVSVDGDEVSVLSQPRRNRLGAAMIDLLFREIFEFRVVQTDTHFGNYLIQLDDNGLDRIVLFDFGAVRKFPKRYVDPLRALILASIDRDRDQMIAAATAMGYLRETDTDRVYDVFQIMCDLALEPFSEERASTGPDDENGYDWGQSDLLARIAKCAKDAAFAVKFRPPPRETIFLDRKLVGVYIFLKTLQVRYGPWHVINDYVR